MTAPSAHAFHIGALLRVTVDEPFGTHLKANDLVTVARHTQAKLPNGTTVPALAVETSQGLLTLTPTVLELADVPDYTPGESDDVVDVFFDRLVAADPELATIIGAALTAFDTAEDPLAAGMHKAHKGEGAAELADPYSYEDEDEDNLAVHYYQAPGHDTLELGFLFQLNDQWIKVPVQHMRPLLDYLVAGMRRAQKGPNG